MARLDPQQAWSATGDRPVTRTRAGINSRYAELAAGVSHAHFVLDTSRNGQGPWTPAAGTTTRIRRPGATRPAAASVPAEGEPGRLPLIDAYLWIKTPGQSDGQCNRGVAGSTTDPEWGGITDPAAGAWFGRQALQLARLASPELEVR